MEVAKEAMISMHQSLFNLQEDCGIDMNGLVNGDPSAKNNARSGLNFGLSAVVYEWARGVPFKDITNMTLTAAGSIVRCITRLDELCRDFRNAARIIGNPSLYRKMEAVSLCIKRDIVFAASLYVS